VDPAAGWKATPLRR